MRWLLYQALMSAGLLASAPGLLVTRGRHYLPTLSGRLGRAEPRGAGAARGSLWIHAVSVGEVGVAATLVRELPGDLPLLVTTVTPTGQERAQDLLGDRATIAYLPFDLGFAVGRFFARYAPSALILIEGDYWPLVLRDAARREMPVAVVNGRVSGRSFGRLQRLPAKLRGVFFETVARFGVQTVEDQRRLVELGVEAERVITTGNLKYDTPEPPAFPELESRLRELADGRPLLIAGSTMRGEDEAVLEAFAELGGARALLVLVPRHPERWDDVARLVTVRGFSLRRRSSFEGETGPWAPGRIDVVLLDSMGELASLYRLAAGAFIGGTLVPTGGHNPLEPARFEVPVVVGPSMHNFAEMAERFDAAGAWQRAADSAELAEVWRGWLDDPAAAAEVGRRGGALVEESRGAARRSVEMLVPCLEAVRARADHRMDQDPA